MDDRRVVPRGDGRFDLRLPREEREVLRTLPAELRELLGTDDPALERLFPPAHADDPEREAEYRALIGDELMRGRLSALEVVEATIDAPDVDEEELSAWARALNDLRLVFGSRLEVTEDLYEEGIGEEDPRYPAWALYQYLGFLQSQVVDALAADLD